MAGTYEKVKIKKFVAPQVVQSVTSSEAKFWRKFRFPILLQQFAAVTCVDFNPIAPHEFAVSSSTRVQIFNPSTNEPRKTITRFKDVAYSARFRGDGKLLVAGGEEGVVRIFDTSSRSIFRSFEGHKKPVRYCRFSTDQLHVMSGGDDATVRNWDLTTGAELSCLEGHTDQIRCGYVSPASADVWISGSYDHTVRLWDMRSNECIRTLDHGAPVEDLLMYPGGGICVTAGGRSVKIWDILGGYRLLETLTDHGKTVTGLSLDSARSRLFTANLDHQVKVYDTNTYKTVHNMRHSAPLLCVGMSPDSTHLVTGMADGQLSIRHRTVGINEQVEAIEKRRNFAVHSWRYLMRGRDEYAPQNAYKVERGRKQKLAPYDNFLRKFQYRKALDAGLKTSNPTIVVSLFEEFMRRKALFIPLSGRNEVTIVPILEFLIRYIREPQYMQSVIPVAEKMLELYAAVLGQSPRVDALFRKLQKVLHKEIQAQKQMMSVVGILDLIFAQNSAAFGEKPAILAPATTELVNAPAAADDSTL